MTDLSEPLAIDPSTEVDSGLSPTEVRVCPGCGRPEQLWGGGGAGFLSDDGNSYCCAGCAQQTGCTCG